MWYIWQGEGSSLFGKTKMTTFERYYIEDAETHHEPKNIYYTLRNEKECAELILSEFGIRPDRGHIVNGHTPVKERKRSEEHTSELQSRFDIVCRLLLEKKNHDTRKYK